MSEFSILSNSKNESLSPNLSKSRNIEEIREYETALKDSLNAANAAGEAIVYPTAIRTKYCACKPDAETDCRFHSRNEPGWEICPEIQVKEQIGRLKSGRWLYITTGEPLNQDDPTEAQDAALEKRLSDELIRSVQ